MKRSTISTPAHPRKSRGVPLKKSPRAPIKSVRAFPAIKKLPKKNKKIAEIPVKKTPRAKKSISSKKKLSKSDPDYYSKIGHISGTKLFKERGSEYFSEIAKKSHPRSEYHGGRPRKDAKNAA